MIDLLSNTFILGIFSSSFSILNKSLYMQDQNFWVVYCRNSKQMPSLPFKAEREEKEELWLSVNGRYTVSS